MSIQDRRGRFEFPRNRGGAAWHCAGYAGGQTESVGYHTQSLADDGIAKACEGGNARCVAREHVRRSSEIMVRFLAMKEAE